MAYAIAFSTDGATDVSSRYIRKAEYALERSRCPEAVLLYIVDEIRTIRRQNMSSEQKLQLKKEDTREKRELQGYAIASITAGFVAITSAAAGGSSRVLAKSSTDSAMSKLPTETPTRSQRQRRNETVEEGARYVPERGL